jgi:type VI protein secretion system component VasF
VGEETTTTGGAIAAIAAIMGEIGSDGTMERDDGREESRRILDRVAREVEASSPMTRVARRAQEHFGATDADQQDRIEIWGTRIGRALALVIVLVLLYGFILLVLRGG